MNAFLPEYQGLFSVIAQRNRAKVLLNALVKVKAHGFCISNPETAHFVAFARNPVLAGDSAKRIKQIFVGNRNNAFLLAPRLGELEALRFIALAGTNRKYLRFSIYQRADFRVCSLFLCFRLLSTFLSTTHFHTETF